MKVSVRYFASIREALGSGEPLELTEGASVSDAKAALMALGERHAEVFRGNRAVRCAVNQELANDSAALKDDDELAFFPPVTGG